VLLAGFAGTSSRSGRPTALTSPCHSWCPSQTFTLHPGRPPATPQRRRSGRRPSAPGPRRASRGAGAPRCRRWPGSSGADEILQPLGVGAGVDQKRGEAVPSLVQRDRLEVGSGPPAPLRTVVDAGGHEGLLGRPPEDELVPAPTRSEQVLVQ